MHEIFLDELKKLNTQFMEMGVLVNDDIDHATRALLIMIKRLRSQWLMMKKRFLQNQLIFKSKP